MLISGLARAALSVAACAVFVLSIVPAAVAAEKRFIAIVAGVSDYSPEYPKITEVAEQVARSLEAYARKRGYDPKDEIHVYRFLDQGPHIESATHAADCGFTAKPRICRPNREDLVRQLARLKASFPDPENSTLVFYFHGHGEAANDGLVLKGPGWQGPGDDATDIAFNDILTKIDEIPVRHKLIILDACRAKDDGSESGGATYPSALTTLKKPTAGNTTPVIWFSTTGGKRAYLTIESRTANGEPVYGGGYFSSALTKELDRLTKLPDEELSRLQFGRLNQRVAESMAFASREAKDNRTVHGPVIGPDSNAIAARVFPEIYAARARSTDDPPWDMPIGVSAPLGTGLAEQTRGQIPAVIEIAGVTNWDRSQLVARKIIFRDGAQLVFSRKAVPESGQLFIAAQEIVSEGQDRPALISISDQQPTPATPVGNGEAGVDNGSREGTAGGHGAIGPTGSDGADGKNAPTLALVASDALSGKLLVKLKGSDGANGGTGGRGGRGGGGGYGTPASQSAFDCKRGPGNGAPGGNGGPGGPGGRGGAAGNGGELYLVLPAEIAPRASDYIGFDLSAGRRGEGGGGGIGGTRGDGGRVGQEALPFCRRGDRKDGPPGTDGPDGKTGPAGAAGKAGSVHVYSISNSPLPLPW